MTGQAPLIPIVEETDDFIVINKPTGVCMHSNDGPYPLLKVLQHNGVHSANYLVHRLDTDTSGLMIIAKHAEAAGEFGRMFEQHRIQKYYIALGMGKGTKKQGHVLGDMCKARNGNYRLEKTQHNPAYTQFFSFALPNSQRQGLRLYLLKPLTGKTHQLRVALKSISAPIAGDSRYGGAKVDRMYLHAYQLNFYYRGQQFQLQAKPCDGDLWNDSVSTQYLTDMTTPHQLQWPKRLFGAERNV